MPELARAHALIEATRAVAASGDDLGATLDAIEAQAEALLGADAASISVFAPDGRTVVRRRPHPLAVPGSVMETAGLPIPLDEWAAAALAQGRAATIDDYQRAGEPTPAVQASLPSVIAAMVVPLVAAGETLGVFFADWTRPHAFDPEEVEMAEAFAAHAAIAIRTARLLEQARLATARMAGLQRVTAALADALDPDDVARIVVAEGAMALGARAALLARVTREGQGLEIVASKGFPADRVGAWRRIPIDAPVPLADAVRRRTLIRLPSRAAAIEAYPALATALPHRHHYALVVLPVVGAGGTLGVLGVSFSATEVGDSEEDALLQTLARQCGQALERAALYRAEQSGRAELEALLDAVEDAIVVYDANGRIRRTNRRARERFQRRWDTLPGSIGEILALCAPTRPRGDAMPRLAVEVALGEGRVCDDVVDDREGAGAGRRYFEVAVPLRDGGGAISGAIEVARDVTDLETAIEERARLDGAVKTIRLVAHELGNALTAVAAYGAILPEMVDGQASQIAREMADGAEEAGQLLHKLQRLARFQEMEFGGQVMLDVEASARPYDGVAADPSPKE